MDRFRIVAMALVVLGTVFWCAAGSAELNLWISYHFAGERAYYDGEYAV